MKNEKQEMPLEMIMETDSKDWEVIWAKQDLKNAMATITEINADINKRKSFPWTNEEAKKSLEIIRNEQIEAQKRIIEKCELILKTKGDVK
jgi:hypothetical protein